MPLFISGIGTSVPPHFIGQEDASAIAGSFCSASTSQQGVLTRLYERSGVHKRHSVLLENSTNGSAARQSFYPAARHHDDAGPTTEARMRRYEDESCLLGIGAGQRALERSGTSSEEITHLVTVSCTGFHAPGLDLSLIEQLRLPAGVERTHIGFMGCHAALNGLRVAKAFTDSKPEACVLLCAVELCSLHYQYGWKPEQIVANAIFADGAAALVARGRAGRTDSWQLVSSASFVVPDTADTMSWRIRDFGFEMTLSTRVPDLIVQHLAAWLNQWLEQFQLQIDEIGSWAIHPGGPRILSACREACNLTEDQLLPSTSILAEFGNMSSPTVLFILDRLAPDAARPCVALAFGPGLTIEAALLT